jgi:dihydrofolate reductase
MKYSPRTWPYQPADSPVAAGLNAARKYVVSNTLRSVEWQNSTLISGDAEAKIRTLKAQDGPDLSVIGSAGLAQSLLRHALIDEYRLWIFPLVVGKGKRLFADGAMPGAMTLTGSKVSTIGVVMNTYVPAGEIRPGSFVSDTPSEKELERRAKMAGCSS